MADDIYTVSNLFCGRTTITSKDYKEVLHTATKRDLVYMDPPYQGVCSSGDARYYGGIDFEEFMQALAQLAEQGIPFILSYDGRTGNKSFGRELPCELELYRIEVRAGRSTQATLLGGNAITYESIYLSKALVKRLDIDPQELANRLSQLEVEPPEPMSLKGICENKGFEKISDLESELKLIRSELSDSILKKEF